MRAIWIYAALLAAASFVSGQEKHPDLIGTLTFQVDSPGGRVENLIVTIGDGGTGPYKAVLTGDSSLPTHAIYRPRDLSGFGSGKRLPIVAFGNGGCRNGSGEFRNLLSDVASHGFVVVAIGPAGEAVVGGSEGRQNQTKASQLLDGVEWITNENERQGSDYFHKIDTSKVAVMGQSCGTRQAAEVSSDPRVTTTVLLNGGEANLGSAAPQARAPRRKRAAGPSARSIWQYQRCRRRPDTLSHNVETSEALRTLCSCGGGCARGPVRIGSGRLPWDSCFHQRRIVGYGL